MVITYYTHTSKQKQFRKASKVYLKLEDKREIMSDIGDAALILFEYYLSKSGTPNFDYSDKKAANALGWTIRKVLDVRLKLTKAGYFLQRKGKYNDGSLIVTTYLGKEEVSKTKELVSMSKTCTDEQNDT